MKINVLKHLKTFENDCFSETDFDLLDMLNTNIGSLEYTQKLYYNKQVGTVKSEDISFHCENNKEEIYITARITDQKLIEKIKNEGVKAYSFGPIFDEKKGE